MYWDQTPAMVEMPVNACVATPLSEATVSLDAVGAIKVKGYAVPQGDQGPVVRVQVAGDEGATWADAQMYTGGEAGNKWSWALWNARVSVERGKGKSIYAKATDANGNVQKEKRSAWNLRGVGYDGYEAIFGLTVV